MQQVAAGSKFWWRAQDAPTLPEALLDADAEDGDDALPIELPEPVRSEQPGYVLKIPRGERRRRRATRSVRRAAFGFALVTTMAACGAVAMSSPSFDPRLIGDNLGARVASAAIALGLGIEQVSVTGQRFVSDADVFDALDLAHVRGFWQLDAGAALKRIERIAWVDAAQITRAFPGRLDVEIRERTPAALWTRGDALYLVDATGRVLGPAGLNQRWSLPRIAGEGANADASLLLAALRRHPEIASKVATSERIAERRWRIVFDNGSRIELAAEREVEGLDHVANSAALRASLFGRAPTVVDVRTQGRIAVRPLNDTLASASARSARLP